MRKLIVSLVCLVLTLFQPDAFSAEKEQSSDIIATVNGKNITQEMLVIRLKKFYRHSP